MPIFDFTSPEGKAYTVPGIPPPPPGFTLDGAAADNVPPPPAGFTLDNQQEPSWAGSAADAARSVGTGIVHGAAGFFPEMAHNAQTLEDIFRQKLGVAPLPPPVAGADEVNAKLDKALGLYQPSTGMGRAAETAGEFIGNPGSYIGGPESLMAKAGMAGLSGLGAYGGQAAGEKLAGPTGGQIGSLVGALGGGALAPAQAAGRYANDVRKVASEIGPKNLSAGDVTGNRTVKAFESELSPRFNEKQDEAVKQAAFNRVGEVIGDRPLQGKGGAVDTMLTRVGKTFDNLQAQSYAHLDAPLLKELQDTHDTFNSVKGLYPTEVTDSINGAINRILDVGHTGTISGNDYQTLRSNLSRAARGSTDPQKAGGLHDIVNALDDATERSLSQTNPQLAGQWSQARRDYTNALVLERWANSANQTPATLAQAAKAVYGKRQYMRGRDDFSDFAESARNVLRQFPDSGTARRGVAERVAGNTGNLAMALGGISGVAGGQYLNSRYSGSDEPVIPFLAGEAGLGTLIGRPALRMATMNPVSQRLLTYGLTPGGPDMSARLARALAQTQGQQQ